MRWSVVRFYSIPSEEVKKLPVPEVLNALNNMNRIRSEEAEFDFCIIGNAMGGNNKFLEELRMMRYTPAQRKKYRDTENRLAQFGFTTKLQ